VLSPSPTPQEVLDRAKVAVEVTTNHADNLKLLKQFGNAAWSRTLDRAEAQRARLEREAAALQARATAVNRKRKQEQLAVAGQLNALEERYGELVLHNHVLALERRSLALAGHKKARQ
jgi:cell division septum initiation protein DivIVA